MRAEIARCRRWSSPARPAACSTAAQTSAGQGVPAPGRRLRGVVRATSRAVSIRERLKIILQMAAVLTYGADAAGGQGRPHRRAVRQAALRARPRSVDDVELPTFRGHMLHGDEPTAAARDARPSADAAGLPPVRRDAQPAARVHEGRLRRPRARSTPGTRSSSPRRRRAVATRRWPPRSSGRCASWPRAAIDLRGARPLHEVDIWTSHEALLLDYEEALTRRDSLTGDWYDCSAHLLWIGERTRQPDGAHVEFFAGVHNPVGVKAGPQHVAGRPGRALRGARPRPRCRAG